MSKHTPGPWSMTQADWELGLIAYVPGLRPAAGGARGVQYNIVASKKVGSVTTDNSEADAALIAAAPDLLEACKALLDCPDTNLDELDPITVAAIDTAIAAIAKAEGGEA
jgi:hypothetical protein